MELWNPLRSLISFLNSADESHQSICFKFPICDANLIIFISVDVQQNYLIFMEYFEILTWFALFNKCLIFTGGKILFIVFVKKSIPRVCGLYRSTYLKQIARRHTVVDSYRCTSLKMVMTFLKVAIISSRSLICASALNRGHH